MKDAVFTGLPVKIKTFQNGGKIIQLSWTAEQVKELQNYVNASGYLNIDLKDSRSGKKYMQVNMYGVDFVPKDEEVVEVALPAKEEDDGDLDFLKA